MKFRNSNLWIQVAGLLVSGACQNKLQRHRFKTIDN